MGKKSDQKVLIKFKRTRKLLPYLQYKRIKKFILKNCQYVPFSFFNTKESYKIKIYLIIDHKFQTKLHVYIQLHLLITAAEVYCIMVKSSPRMQIRVRSPVGTNLSH